MIKFIIDNIGTIAVGLALAATVAVIVGKIISDKCKGKSIVCGCACANCPKSNACQTNKK